MDDDQPSPESPEQQRHERRTASTRQFAAVMELPFIFVGAVIVGGLFGFFLDRWLGTRPFLMLVLGACGFYAGVREVWRRVNDVRGKRDEPER